MTNNSAMTSEDYSWYPKFTRMASPILYKNSIISSNAYGFIALRDLWTIMLFITAGFRPHNRPKYEPNISHQSRMEITQ